MIGKIGQANFGLYTLATSFITFFAIDFGLSSAVTRFVSKYNAENNPEKVSNFLGITYKLYMLISAIIFIVLLVLYFFIGSIYKNLNNEELETFKILYIIVGLYTVIQFPFITLNGILTSYEKFIPLKTCDLLHKVLIVILMVFFLLKGYGVFALVSVNAGVGLFLILLKLIIINKQTNCSVNFKFFNKSLLKEIFGFSIWVTISTIAQRFIFNITPSIIAAVSVTGSIGCSIFGLASTIEGYIYIIASAINGMFLTRISRFVNTNSNDELNNLSIKIGRIQLFIVGFIITFFIGFGKTFIVYIWHRPEFSLSYFCAILLILPSFFQLPMEIANSTIIVKNKVRLQAYIYIGMAIINFILSIILSKYFGPVGASLSICIAYLFRTFMLGYISHKYVDLNMKKFFKIVFLNNAIFYILLIIICLCLDRLNIINNIQLKFFINSIIYILLYCLILFKFVFNDYEKNLFIKPILKIFKRR